MTNKKQDFSRNPVFQFLMRSPQYERLDRLGAEIFVLTPIDVLSTSRWENGNKNQKITI